MTRWIVTLSLRFRFVVVGGALIMLVLGGLQLRDLRVDAFPEFAPRRVEIQTACLGLSAEEVERLVTVPLEEALGGVSRVDTLRSKSAAQLSAIELIFQPGTELFTARRLVQERLAVIAPTLPSWASPPIMMPPVSATSRVMQVGLTSKTLPLTDLSMTAYWKIRARLLRVPGVANVAMWGERLKMLQVQVDPGRMGAVGVPLDGVVEATADALDAGVLQFAEGAGIGSGGFFDGPTQRLGVRYGLPLATPDDLAQIPVEAANDTMVRLDAVANVVEGHQPLIGDAVINGHVGLLLVIEKLPWSNTLNVSRGIEAALNDMRPGLHGIDIEPRIFRQATFVETALHNLKSSLLIGSLLVVAVLLLFLFEWRSALISVITVPLSILPAVLVLHAWGGSINTMVLAGLAIALGAMVDDAIVDVENIVRRLRVARAGDGGSSDDEIIRDACVEVRSAVVYASIIEVVAVAPVFLLKGVTGAFFRPLALAFAVAVIVSLVESLIVTPALAGILFRGAPLTSKGPPLTRVLQRAYEKVLRPIVSRPLPALASTAVLALAAVVALPSLGQSLFPEFKERDFLMHWITKPGTSLTEQRRLTERVSRELLAVPGVRSFGSHIGQALQGEEIAGVDFGEHWVSIDAHADYDRTLAKIRAVADRYPGIYQDVQTYLNERIGEVLSGEGHPVVVRLFGPDLDVLRANARKVRRVLTGVAGISDAHVELEANVAQVHVAVDPAKVESVGLKAGDVRRAASTLIAGEEVGDIYNAGKTYDVQVWSTPATRANVAAVGALLLDTPGGSRVPLSSIASVTVGPTPNSIRHEGGSRRIDVAADVRGRDLGSVARAVQSRIDALSLPLGYRSAVLGEFAEHQNAQSTLLTFAAVAALSVLMLLRMSFARWRLAVLSFLTLPIALVGGVLAAFGTSRIVSLGSLVGFFAVLGIVARNGIMLVSHYQHLEEHEGQSFGPDLVIRGARERLAPILMTGLATALALIPLVVAGDIPGQEIEYPMAIVILGGLVTSALLNLFVVPTLYLRFAKNGHRLRRRDTLA